jgi:hypothetical protein
MNADQLNPLVLVTIIGVAALLFALWRIVRFFARRRSLEKQAKPSGEYFDMCQYATDSEGNTIVIRTRQKRQDSSDLTNGIPDFLRRT